MLFPATVNLYTGSGYSADFHIDYRYQSRVYGGSTAGRDVPGRESLEIPSYDTVNARLAFGYEFARGDYLEIALWVRNIFDEEYQQQVIGQGSVAPTQNALGEVIYGYEQQVSVWAEPARYGIDLNYVF